jgi:molybdopterin converting factor small subunit
MATVNKNFKVKNGLVVEGTTATVNGNQVLSETASDQYIIDLIGGETLVTSVESTQMEVVAGELNIKSGVFDASGAAAAAQTAAQDFATAADTSLYTTVTSDISTAKSQAISAAATDATSKADAAEASANSYTDDEIGSLDLSLKAYADQAESDAISTASADATAKANAAQSAAEATASADATSKANAAQAAAELTASNANTALYTTVTGDISTAKAQAISAAEGYTDSAVSALVNGAPELLNTLDELAQALGDAPDTITNLTTLVGTKAATSYVDSEISDLDTAAQGYASAAQTAAEATASADATSKANAAQAAAEATAALDATSKANAAEAASNLATDGKITQEVADRNSAISSAIDTEVTNRNTAIGAAITQEVADRNSAITSAVNNISTTDIEEGTNLYFTNQRAIDAVGGTIGDQINLLDTDDIEEGSNLYFTNQRALDATAAAYDMIGAAGGALEAAQDYADGLAINYDAAGSAATAYSDAVSAAASDATTKANAAQSAAELTASNALTTAVGNLEDYADTAEQDAKNYADALIDDASGASTKVWSAYKTSTEIGLAQAAAEQHADDAVAALVGSAPALLDTLQELAAALDNDPEAINSLQSIAAGKQDTLTAGDNIAILGPVISVTGLDAADISDFNTAALSATSAAYDAAGSADDAQAAAEATAQAALDDVLDGTTAFTEINVNSEAKQIAATSSSLGSVVVTAYSWPKADYRSAKLMVKIDNATDNEVSEILLTLDSSDNIAITEYAIVGTNGSRGSITARVSGANVEVRVDPVNDSTIKVTGTLLK